MRISDWSSDVCSSDLSFLREGLGIWDRVGGLGVFTAGAWSRRFIGNDDEGKALEPAGEPLALGIAADVDQTWLSLGAARGNDEKIHCGSVLRLRADTEADEFVTAVTRIQAEHDVPVGRSDSPRGGNECAREFTTRRWT